MGESLALADVNGDGKAELLAGAWSYDPGGGAAPTRTTGSSGSTTARRARSSSRGSATERAEGIQDEMGRAVAFGDVNGTAMLDSRWAPAAGPATSRSSAAPAYTVDRRRYLVPRRSLAWATRTSSGAPWRSADLNGDGKGEVIAGAHVGDGGGLGIAAGSASSTAPPGHRILHQFNGTASQDHFGKSGRGGRRERRRGPDVIIGAEWGTVEGFPPGAGYVRGFKGLTAEGLTDEVLLEVHGSCDSDHLGTSVAVRPVDGTDQVNILAGAPDGDADAKLDNGYIRLY